MNLHYFFGRAQSDAITAPKQVAMPVVAPAVVGDLIAIADGKAILGAVGPDRILHKAWEGFGEGRIELASIDVRREQSENVGASAGPVAALAVGMAAMS